MDGIRPDRMPRHDILMDQCFEAAQHLKHLLGQDISEIQNNADSLLDFTKNVKESYRNFNELCHKAICSSFRIGSRDEGNSLKLFKNDVRHETDELIALVVGYLEELNIEFEISGLTYNTSTLSINDNLPSSPTVSSVNVFRNLDDEPLLPTGSRSPTVVQSMVCLLYTSPSPRDKRQSRMPSSA